MKLDPDPLALARIETAQEILEGLGAIVQEHGESEALAALLTAAAVASHQIGVAKGAVSALRKMIPLVAEASKRVGPDATSLDLLVELYTR
jgi:hypothetical protein